MKFRCNVFTGVVVLLLPAALYAQTPNCFLQDYYPKYTTAPPYVTMVKPVSAPSVTITINGADTIGPVSNYLMGEAAAVWVGQNINNPTMTGYLQKLSPGLIRFPGGSWSDVYFWNGNPGDLPAFTYRGDSMYAHGTLVSNPFSPQLSAYYPLTLDSYYNLRDQVGSQGLITINYAYARYGLSSDPVAQAAHYAADWVRYDAGRTEFWEIGNENAGFWEEGYVIDTVANQDHQPLVITGQLYGKHFKVFADSMRAAAREIGATIYIGGQVIQYDATTDANVVNRAWNAGFFSEVGDSADFYVMHNYFGKSTTNLRTQVDNGRTEIVNNINFIRQDIVNKGAVSKPVAVTEWNMLSPDAAKTSIANGMQAVVLFCEFMKNNFGMSCRWPIANWDADGMFYFNNTPVYPLWNPRPDFYYAYYLRQFMGDHAVNLTYSPVNFFYAYASMFTSGHTGLVVVNATTSAKVVKVVPANIGVGDKFYIYSLTGIDATTWPQSVVVNGLNPTGTAWGPLDSLTNIRAWGYPIGDTIVYSSPASSVQFILIDNGTRNLTGVNDALHQTVYQFALQQNYPNPFNPQTTISYSLPQANTVTLKVFDVMGREVAVLRHGVRESAGEHSVTFDASSLSSGVYFYRLSSGSYVQTKKMLLVK